MQSQKMTPRRLIITFEKNGHKTQKEVTDFDEAASFIEDKMEEGVTQFSIKKL